MAPTLANRAAHGREGGATAARRAGLWVPTLDGFRAIVIWLIVAKHMWNAAERPDSIELVTTILNSGVFFKLFYVISGFALFLPIAARQGGLGSGQGRWIARRFARITPSYYLVLAIVLVAYPLLLLPGQVDSRSVGSVLAHLAYLQQELYPLSAGFGVDGPLWALSMFALFYLTLPFVARPFFRHPLPWIVGAIVVSTIWQSAADGTALKQYPLFVQDFALGMGAAWLLVRVRREPRLLEALRAHGPAVVGVLALSLLGLVVASYAAGSVESAAAPVWRNSALVNTAVPLCFGLLLLSAALAPSALQRPLSGRTAAFLADTSFGVFLIHMVAIKFVMVRNLDLTGIDAVGAAAGIAAFSLAFGYLSFRFIERPIRDRMAAPSALARSRAAPQPG